MTALRNAFIETSTVSPADRARLLRYGRVLTGSVSITERMLGVQAQASVEVVALVAERMGVDPGADLRPRVIVTAMTAVAAGGFRDWVEGGGRGSPSSPIGDGLALLELGLASCDERPRGRGVNRR